MTLPRSPRFGRAMAATAVVSAALMAALPAATASASTHTARTTPAVVQPVFTHVLPGSTLTNSHWSGYDATSGGYTSVSASWTQPSVNCSQGGDVVFWVGLGGGTAKSDSLQQNGTFVQCEGSTPVYSAWWETYPCNDITNYGGTVKAGDKITASTVNMGGNKYQLTVTDSTEGWSVDPTKTGCDGGTEATAEVITETPGIGGGLADLPNYKNVKYTSATINNAALASANPAKVVMKRGTVIMNETTAITGGNSFRNTWEHNS
ncbi:MAG: G1 family glutamic endopeptidase [Streptosporangiaceae bacterium]